MAKKPAPKAPIPEKLDGLSIEQVTGIIELGKGACTDTQARIPEGTLKSLVKLGYAVRVPAGKGYKGAPGYAPTDTGRAKAREWLSAGLSRMKAAQPAQGAKPIVKFFRSSRSCFPQVVRSTGKLPLTLAITALKDENPSRPGTKAHGFYTLIQAGGTVATYLEKGGAMAYLTWFIDRGLAEAK